MKAEGEEVKVKQIENLVAEQFANSLNLENFYSRQNCSNIIAFSAFFAIKAQKLNDLASLSVLVSTDEVAGYFMSSTSLINAVAYLEEKHSLEDS